MSYKYDVIKATVDSMNEGGYPGASTLVPVFEQLYDCGYNEAGRMYRDDVEFLRDRLKHSEEMLEYNMKLVEKLAGATVFPPVKTTIGCDVCGLGGSNVSQAMGYVCPRGDCPTKVTC